MQCSVMYSQMHKYFFCSCFMPGSKTLQSLQQAFEKSILDILVSRCKQTWVCHPQSVELSLPDPISSRILWSWLASKYLKYSASQPFCGDVNFEQKPFLFQCGHNVLIPIYQALFLTSITITAVVIANESVLCLSYRQHHVVIGQFLEWHLGFLVAVKQQRPTDVY